MTRLCGRYSRSRLFLLGILCTLGASLMFAYNLRYRDGNRALKPSDVQTIDVSKLNYLKSLERNVPKLSTGVAENSAQKKGPYYLQEVVPELTERNVPLFEGKNIQLYERENVQENRESNIDVFQGDVQVQVDTSENDSVHPAESVQEHPEKNGHEGENNNPDYLGDNIPEEDVGEDVEVFHWDGGQGDSQVPVPQEKEDEVLCKFPELDPFDPAIRKFFPVFETVKCRGTPAITKVEGGVLRFVDEITMSELIGQGLHPHCRYRPILRHPKSSILYKTTPWKEPLEDGHIFSDDEEIVHVECYNDDYNLIAEAFHLIIQIKPEDEIMRNKRFTDHLMADNPTEILNVVLIGIDSTSRMNYIRSLPRTRRLLATMGGIEMEMYNKIADNTVPNLTGFFTGLYFKEHARHWNPSQHMDNWDFLWHHYKEAGYRTLFVEEFVNTSTDHIFHTSVHKGFAQCPADYCNRPLTAYIMQARDRKERHDQNFCLGPTSEIDINLRYVRDFIAASINTPHFVFTWLWKYGHQNPAMTLASDEKYVEFLRGLQDDHLLDKTMLVFFSDHGSRYGEFRSTFNGMIEERAPFLTVVFPKWFHEQYPNIIATLKTNSRRLTTHFDMHETLLDVLRFSGAHGYGDITQRGISLFNEIPKGRTCKDAQLASHWCLCKTMESRGSLSEETANYFAQALLLNVNTIAKAHEEYCVRFQLLEIIRVVEQVVQDKPDARGGDDVNKTFMVTIKTTPGDAIFEATVVQGPNNKALVKGQISRLTSYHSQAACVTDPSLKLYCYCRDKHETKGDSVAVMEDLL